MEAEEKPAAQQLERPQKVKGTKIKKLVLDGFKSFGKYTELLFGDDFNVVLGPNGSGKSNILDAICFCLGKSSSKQLRAEKSANLIYNGGKTKQPGKQAEVSIVFDNSDNTFPFDEKEIKISRIVRKDGASKYKINNQTKTRQEILELLGIAKINPDGYNIILQGDIVRLVEMSPNDRRGIIEEIAGIGMYEEKKNQALNELNKVEEKLNEAEIILKERESYLKDLKKDRDQAVKYKELNDKIRTNRASYLKRQIMRKDDAISKLEKRNAGHQEKLDKYQAQITKLRKEIEQNKQTIADINKEIEEKGEVQQIQIQKEVEHLRVNIATHKTRISACNTELERIKQRKEQLTSNLKDVEEKIAELHQQKQEFGAQLEAIGKTTGELDARIKSFREKHNLKDEKDVDKELDEIDKQAEQKQHDIQLLREKQQSLIREKDKADFQLTAMDEKIAKVQKLESAHKEELDLLKKKKDQFKKITLDLNKMLNQDSEDAKTLARGREELQGLREEQNKLSIKQASIKDNIAANIAVKKVMENKGQLGEIYGTVAELGSSESKYAGALEVAAANKIHSVVVEDDQTAARCIKYLKREKLGVATFLPLNKIKAVPLRDDVKRLTKEKGVHGFAVDLIDYDPKFKNVFSHVFGNTLVVDSIDAARKIGIGKARMVTTDGDLAERSGAMVGGFRHKKTGSFKEKEVGKKLETITAKIQDIESKIKNIEHYRKENEEKIARSRELKANIEGDIIKQEKSLHLETGDLDATRKYKEELVQSSEKIENELRALEDEIADSTSELTQLKMKKQNLRTKITELRNPSVLAELTAFEEKKKQLERETVRLETEQKGIDMQLKDVLGRDRENMHKLVKDMKKEEEAFSGEISDLKKLTKSQEQDLKKKEAEQTQFFSKYKGLFEKVKKLQDENNARESKILGVEENARKEELSVNTLSIEKARLNAEKAGLDAEFEKYTDVELNMKKPEEQLKKEIDEFERMMVKIGNVNMRALEIFEQVEKEYARLLEKKNVLMGEKEDVVKLMEEIETNKKDLFLNTLQVVDDQFRRIFSQLTTKGEAYLVLENKEDPLAGGLRINVKITGNKFLDIRSLSGGEKTMTALAFLFAIQEHEPASFYVLDEVDAALDKHNSEKLAKLIRSYCSKAQYVVISHNDALISEGDILYGVSMKQDAGLSNVVSLKA